MGVALALERLPPEASSLAVVVTVSLLLTPALLVEPVGDDPSTLLPPRSSPLSRLTLSSGVYPSSLRRLFTSSSGV